MGENIYFFMIIVLAVLAITDLVVGVSNDAVNFLNSAIGSKAISFKTIMIVASFGIAFGAISSSGMMEVARKGIFNPSEFVFAEIMIVFMAVMIADILLLDFFNTLGMPTSTTVSIVFELLGAAVAISLVKIYAGDGNLTHLVNYINTDKATEIIFGILISVVIAFTIGAFVQFLTRVLLSFKFGEKAHWVGSIFGSLAITAIVYFIIAKGLTGTSILGPNTTRLISDNPELFILVNIVVWFVFSWLVSRLLNWNIYVIIIILGTFALAMSFAGNDLVNFIGVPLAAYESFTSWSNSGQLATDFNMRGLAVSVQTPTYLLLASGLVMVLTLWFSSKAKNVVKTSVDLSRQDEGDERFEPNFLSRQIVKYSIKASDNLNGLLPKGIKASIDKQFEKPTTYISKTKIKDQPAFDLVRASVNLMVASVLISMATSLKLPLSTTYVTFMVAMGSSLADRAWGSESAVYRVAGVLNVIGGWFFTAVIAFVAAAIIAYIIHLGGLYAIVILLILAFILIGKNYISHTKKLKESKEEEKLERAESSSVQGVIEESAKNIANVVKRANKIYSNTINGLAKQDLNQLQKNKKQSSKLSSEIEDLRDHTFYFIKNLEEAQIGASNFYINAMGHLTDISQSLDYIGRVSHKHVNNNHRKLKYNQIKELKQIDYKLAEILNNTQTAFEERSFEKIGAILNNKQELYDLVSQKIERQVERTRTEESSPKNTTLYFSILLETKDLMTATMNLLEQYYKEYDDKIEPARLD